MSVDLRKVKKLIELVEESDIAELEVRDGDETIRIARRMPALGAPTAAAAPPAADAQVVMPAAAPTAAPSSSQGFTLRSPMAGTFYHAPAPGAEPFLVPGQSVSAGDVLCIIESMKMMNEIKADRAGICTAILVENGEAIGSGQRLFSFE